MVRTIEALGLGDDLWKMPGELSTGKRKLVALARAVVIEPDPDFSFRDKVGRHYGADLSTRDQPGDLRYVVTLRPSRVNAQ